MMNSSRSLLTQTLRSSVKHNPVGSSTSVRLLTSASPCISKLESQWWNVCLCVGQRKTDQWVLHLPCGSKGLSYSALRHFSRNANLSLTNSVDVKGTASANSDGKEDRDATDDVVVSSQDLMGSSAGGVEEMNLLGVHEVESEPAPVPNSDGEDVESAIAVKQPVSAASLSLPELSRRNPATLSPYVNRSKTLQKLVQLGVDLSQVQQFEGMASLLVRSKFKRDIAPYVRFLHQVQVPSDKLGHVLTVNPHILTEDLDEMETRIGYLVHKKFSLSEIGLMVAKAPVILLMSPQQMDSKLAFLQQTFDLTASEVRQVVISLPRLLPFKKDKIALTRFQVKSFLGFTDEEMKQIVLKEPSVLLGDQKMMGYNFDYLHNTMLIPHSQMLDFPGILLHRIHILQNRHLFLLSRRRAQYDPCQENYVSLKALVMGNDEAFCRNVAKTDLETYYAFLKTL